MISKTLTLVTIDNYIPNKELILFFFFFYLHDLEMANWPITVKNNFFVIADIVITGTIQEKREKFIFPF